MQPAHYPATPVDAGLAEATAMLQYAPLLIDNPTSMQRSKCARNRSVVLERQALMGGKWMTATVLLAAGLGACGGNQVDKDGSSSVNIDLVIAQLFAVDPSGETAIVAAHHPGASDFPSGSSTSPVVKPATCCEAPTSYFVLA